VEALLRPLLALLLLLPLPSFAGGGRNPFREPDESEFFELDQKLVTVSSRYAQSLRKAPNIVNVIDAEQIRDRGYLTLGDALRDLPGIYVWTTQEGRLLASFRGIVSADNNKVLLLIDGMPLYDGVYTHAWVDDYLPIHHIAQIEVIKGPGSAVYGTNAFAGVINVVTRDASDLEGASARVVAGAPGRLDVGVQAGGTTRVGGTAVSATAFARYLQQDGEGLDTTPRGRRDILGQDPKRNLAVGASLQAGGFEGRITHIDHRHAFLIQEVDDLFDVVGTDIDTFGLQYHATAADVRYRITPVDGLTLTPRAWAQVHDNPGSYAFWGWGADEDGALDTLGITLVETEKRTRQWAAMLDVEARPHPDHVTVAGIGLDSLTVLELVDREFADFGREATLPGFQAPAGARLTNAWAHAAHTWTVAPQLEVTLGGRLDRRFPTEADQDPSDGAFRLLVSPRVGVLLAPSPVVHAKILYGRAFRHGNVRETLVQSTLPDGAEIFPFASGSLDLRPEQIDTLDIEVEADPVDAVTLRAAGSWSSLTREIDKVTPPNAYRNLEGRLDILAAELEATARVDMLFVRAAYALTLASYSDAGPYAGRRQYEFPPHMVKANLGLRPTDALTATLTGEVYSPRPRRDWSPTARVDDGPAFGLLHLGLRAADLGPGGRVSLTGAIRNLTNTDYATGVYRDEVDRVVGSPDEPQPRFPLGQQAPGRSVHVGLEVGL
jgi:outer membrane receptor protein involved in Fe transport